jgi:hypothetical protein
MASGFPVRSHNRAVLSTEAVKMRRPSGANTALVIEPVWPLERLRPLGPNAVAGQVEAGEGIFVRTAPSSCGTINAPSACPRTL